MFPLLIFVAVVAALGYGVAKGSKASGPPLPAPPPVPLPRLPPSGPAPTQPPPDAVVLPSGVMAMWSAPGVGAPALVYINWNLGSASGGEGTGAANGVLVYLAPDGSNGVVQMTSPLMMLPFDVPGAPSGTIPTGMKLWATRAT